MQKDKRDQSNKAATPAEVELVPDAWERFEKAVDQVAKSPPQHRIKGKSETSQKKSRKPTKEPVK